MPRIELFAEEKLIDTVRVERFSRNELNLLLEEMGQVRNTDLTWTKIKAEQKMADAFATKNFAAYNEILKKEEADRRGEQQHMEL